MDHWTPAAMRVGLSRVVYFYRRRYIFDVTHVTHVTHTTGTGPAGTSGGSNYREEGKHMPQQAKA